MKTLNGTGALAMIVAALAVLGCSTGNGDACATDLDCKGDRICGASGQCTDPGDSSASNDGDSSVDSGAATPSSSDGSPSSDGEACVLSGSNCMPECLESCGSSPQCVDQCCPDTTGAGVMCDGQCSEPQCAAGSDTVYEGDERPWICFETEDEPCHCTNTATEENLLDQGATIMPNCPGESCAFDFDGGDWHCQCNVKDPPSEVVFEFGYGAGPIDDCSTMPFARCIDPCEGLALVE